MIGVSVRLQAIADPGQGTTMQLGCGHDIGTEIDQEIVVDEGGGSLAQTGAAERACLLAVVALAKGFGKGIGGGSSQEGEFHVYHSLFMSL